MGKNTYVVTFILYGFGLFSSFSFKLLTFLVNFCYLNFVYGHNKSKLSVVSRRVQSCFDALVKFVYMRDYFGFRLCAEL